MLYDFEVSLSLSAQTVRRCSSENHRSTDHLLDRIYTIRQPLTVNDCFTTPIHDLVYNSTNHEVNLYFPPPPLPRQLFSNVFRSFNLSDNRMHYREYGDIEYEKSLRNRKWSSRERIWREGNFRPVPNANGVSTSSLWKNLCIPVDKPPRSFV